MKNNSTIKKESINVINCPGMYFKDQKTIDQIVNIRKIVLGELANEKSIEEVKAGADSLISLAKFDRIEKGFFDDFITTQNHFKENVECRKRQILSNISDNTKPDDSAKVTINPTEPKVKCGTPNIGGYGYNDTKTDFTKTRNLLLMYADAMKPQQMIGIYHPYGYEEQSLNSLINEKFKEIEFKYDGKEPTLKYKKEKIYICKDMNKNANLIISFRVFDKVLWDYSPEGILKYTVIPLVINGDTIECTMYIDNLTSSDCIKKEWIHDLLSKLKEWFDVDIKTI